MKPNELFDLIFDISYKNVGDDVDYNVFIKEDKIFLSFQGSRTKRDWQNNFNFPRKIYKRQESCMKVARGWGDSYKSCNDIIMSELIELSDKHPSIPVLIIGHSLGGVMALLAAEDFHFRTGKYANVITFGAPKPLFGLNSKRYVEECCGTVKQYCHVHDIVPKLPPLGYHRVDTTKIGDDTWKIWELFKIEYHMSYGDPKLYE